MNCNNSTKKSGNASTDTALQPANGCVIKTYPLYHKIDYPRKPQRRKRTNITVILGRICLGLAFIAFIGSAGRVDCDPNLELSTLGFMILFELSLAGIGAMLLHWRRK